MTDQTPTDRYAALVVGRKVTQERVALNDLALQRTRPFSQFFGQALVGAIGISSGPPIGLERMLRVYFLQQWYALADEALEDALYDSQALQRFARIDLSAEGVPDATTLLNFRHLLETHDLCKGLFAAINADLTARGLLLREGTLVKVSEELVFHRSAIARLRELLTSYRAQKGERLPIAAFKELTGITRKYAIPLLEYLDRERVTRRVGDERVIL